MLNYLLKEYTGRIWGIGQIWITGEYWRDGWVTVQNVPFYSLFEYRGRRIFKNYMRAYTFLISNTWKIQYYEHDEDKQIKVSIFFNDFER